jgi:hypothetical protein
VFSAQYPVDCIAALRAAGWDVLDVEDLNDRVWECSAIPPPGAQVLPLVKGTVTAHARPLGSLGEFEYLTLELELPLGTDTGAIIQHINKLGYEVNHIRLGSKS